MKSRTAPPMTAISTTLVGCGMGTSSHISVDCHGSTKLKDLFDLVKCTLVLPAMPTSLLS